MSTKRQQQECLGRSVHPSVLVKLAPYQLAYLLCQRKKPFTDCEAYAEFAMLADPSSEIFPQMAKGNDAVTEKAVEIREYQKEEIHKAVSAAPFW